MPSLSEARPPGAGEPPGAFRSLSEADRLALLQIARDAIVEAVCHDDLPRVLRNDGIFAERCGVFVTLHVRGRLHGCIGVVGPGVSDAPWDHNEPCGPEGQRSPSGAAFPRLRAGQGCAATRKDRLSSTDPAIEPLGHNLVRCAASAAVADPRFPRLTPEELPDLRIEISLLSPQTPIRPEAIQLGLHGVLVRNDTKRGLLLPQVAIEHHFTVEQFLAETCRKAGLLPDAWQLPSTQLFAFTTLVVSEDEAKPSQVGKSEG